MKFLAASWIVGGLSFFAARSWIGALVFGEIEYTLAVMLALCLVPPIQVLALTWAAGELDPRCWPADWRMFLSRRPVLMLWVMEIAILCLFFAASAGWLALPSAGLGLLKVGAGLMLLGTAGALSVFLRRQTRSSVGVLVAASALMGMICFASGVGLQWPRPWRLSPVMAGVFILVSMLLVPLLLRAARGIGSWKGGPLGLAAVLAAAVFSTTPLFFYLRPYLGAHWIAPALVLLSLGAACVLTTAIVVLEPRAEDEAEVVRRQWPVTIRTGVAVWMVLVASYAVVWIGGAQAFGAGWNLTPRGLLEIVLVPAAQAVAILVWMLMQGRERSLPLVPPRRWILAVVVAEIVMLILVWWLWPAGDGPAWTWLPVWAGVKGLVLGLAVVVTVVRGGGPRRAVIPGLVVLAVATGGLTVWHGAVWLVLTAALSAALAPGWGRDGLLLPLVAITPALLVAVPSLVLNQRPLQLGVSLVITIGVVATSLLFGWLPPPAIKTPSVVAQESTGC